MLVKLNNGLEIDVNKDAFNDMRVFELLADDNPIAFIKVLKFIMKDDQKEKLYKHIEKKNNGRVPVEIFAPIFQELIEKLGQQDKDVKN